MQICRGERVNLFGCFLLQKKKKEKYFIMILLNVYYVILIFKSTPNFLNTSNFYLIFVILHRHLGLSIIISLNYIMNKCICDIQYVSLSQAIHAIIYVQTPLYV